MATVSALPGRLNLRLYRGDDFTLELTLTDVDLTGYTITAEIRDAPNGTSVATFTDTVVDADTGRLNLTLPHATTQTLPDAAVWDLELEVGGVRETWLSGTVTATGDVTEV